MKTSAVQYVTMKLDHITSCAVIFINISPNLSNVYCLMGDNELTTDVDVQSGYEKKADRLIRSIFIHVLACHAMTRFGHNVNDQNGSQMGQCISAFYICHYLSNFVQWDSTSTYGLVCWSFNVSLSQ